VSERSERGPSGPGADEPMTLSPDPSPNDAAGPADALPGDTMDPDVDAELAAELAELEDAVAEAAAALAAIDADG
jgi:hypothetical protein